MNKANKTREEFLKRVKKYFSSKKEINGDPIFYGSSPFIYFICDRAPTDTEADVNAIGIPSTYYFFWWDSTNKERYEFQGGNNGNYVWKKQINPQNISSYVSTVAITGSYNDLSNKPSIFNPTYSSESRSLNTVFQISDTQNAEVYYSIDIACDLTLSGGEIGTVYFETADNEEFDQNIVIQDSGKCGNTGALTIGLATTVVATAHVSGFIGSGKWARLRTENNTGTPIFTYIFGRKIIY